MAGELTHEDRIGPYRQLALLGEDAVGVRYRGADPAGRDVAIKVLKPEVADDPAEVLRLARDIELMSRVLSPHVADVLDGEVSAGHPYVVTRFVPGRPLAEVVAEHGPLRGGALRRLALGLAKALTAIHEAGAVHRGLNPDTVLMVGTEPVIIDFGHPATDPLDDSAVDIRAWAAAVTFAATAHPSPDPVEAPDLDGVPAPLVPVVRSAVAGELTAAELTDAVAALDLGPDQPNAPSATPRAVPLPRRSMSVPGPRGARPAPAARPVHPVGPAWSRLFAALAVVIVVGAAIMMPIAGIVLAVAGAFALRLADVATTDGFGLSTLARGLARTALTLPYAAICTIVVTLGLASLVTLGADIAPSGACAWGVGAGAAALLAGPGIRAPHRQLERLFGAIATEPRRIAVVGVGLGTLAFLSVVGAVSLTPSFTPMYGLQSSLVNSLDRFQNTLP